MIVSKGVNAIEQIANHALVDALVFGSNDLTKDLQVDNIYI